MKYKSPHSDTFEKYCFLLFPDGNFWRKTLLFLDFGGRFSWDTQYNTKLWAYAILPFAIKIDVRTLFFVTCVTVKLYMSGKSMTAIHHCGDKGVSAARLADGQSKTH